MKIAVVGLGHCGSRIADEFIRLNHQAHSERGVDVVTCALAVDTDVADLDGLSHIKSHYQARIVLGGRKAGGHGVGKVNEKGAEIAKEDGDKIISALRSIEDSYKSEAFLVTAATGGGTGSGSLPVVTKMIKERYLDKPVYSLVILPFSHEEMTEERTIYNTGTCLKSLSSVADAIFLVTNERYVNKKFPFKSNLANINEQIVQPFHNLLCTGEEKKSKNIGAKVLAAGDVIEALGGMTVMGLGKAELPLFKIPFWKRGSAMEEGSLDNHGVEAVDSALNSLSLSVNPKNAKKVLYLISAPPKQINVNLIRQVGDYIKNLAPNAILTGGDYPQETRAIEVLLVLSGLKDVEKIRYYYNRSAELMPLYARKLKAIEEKTEEIDEAGKDLPSLLG